MSIEENREKVKQKIINSCLLASDDSGESHAWLFDLRMLLIDPEIASIAAELAWNELKDQKVDFLICTGIAGIMWATYLQQTAYRISNIKLKLMIVRSSKKTYNRKRIVEGDRPAIGDTSNIAFYVDDLTNAGVGRDQALETIRKDGINITLGGIVVIVDFWNKSRILEAQGKKVICLFRRHDLGLTRKDPARLLIEKDKKPYLQLFTKNEPGGHEITSPPILLDNLLYVATNDHFVRCIDLQTKEVVWEDQAQTPGSGFMQKGIINVMPIYNEHLYYTSYHGYVTKLNRFTGEVIWRVLGDRWIHSSPVVSDTGTVVYFSTEYIKGYLPGGDLVALDAITGRTLWRTETPNLMPCTPYLDNGKAYTSSNNSVAYCIDTDTGKIVWSYQMKSTSKGSPVTSDNMVIFVTEGGWIYVFEKNVGFLFSEKRCAYSFRHCIPVLNKEQSTFVVIDQQGYVRCFDYKLTLKWITQTRGSGNWYPIKENNSLYFCNLDGYLIEIDQQTGDKLSYCNVGDKTGSPIALNKQFIVVNRQQKGIVVYER
jgi:outer membrane protein assembly factor BamB/orotate phosphoribosyltransferase